MSRRSKLLARYASILARTMGHLVEVKNLTQEILDEAAKMPGEDQEWLEKKMANITKTFENQLEDL